MNNSATEAKAEPMEASDSPPKRLRKTTWHSQRFRLPSGVREATANIAWLGSDRVLRLGGGLLVGTVVARYLGPRNFGVINYAGAIVGLFNTLSSLGLDSLVVRDLALYPAEESELLGTSFLLKVLASCITTLAAICFAKIADPHDNTTLKIIALLSCAGIFQGFDVVDFFLQAKVRSRYSILPKSVVFVIASLARVAAVSARSPLMTFVWIGAIEVTLSELSLGAAYLTFNREFKMWSASWARAQALLRESWPLLCSTLLILIYMRCDQIILGTLSTQTAVGVYSASTKIVEIWYSIPMLICATVMPRLMKSKDADPKKFATRLQSLYDLMAGLSILIAAAVTLFGKYIILVAYGSRYLDAVPILAVQIWCAVFVFIGVVGATQMTYEKLTILQLHRSIIGAIGNVALNFILVPRYGALGSAVATLIVYSIVAYFYDFFDKRTRHIFDLKSCALNPASLMRRYVQKSNLPPCLS